MEARVEPTGASSVDGSRPSLGRPRSRLTYYLLAGVAVIAIVAGIVFLRHGKTTIAAGPPKVPVTVVQTAQRDVPIYYDALGTVQASLLVRAGVGTIRLIDRDYVEENNLQRQLLYTEADARQGLPKAEAARRHLLEANSASSIAREFH